MKNDELQYVLLYSVLKNFDLEIINGYKYNYQDIGKELVRLRRNGCISDLSGDLEITEIGLKKIEELEKNNNWNYKLDILPQYKYFIEKKGLFDIYLKKDSTS